jgi:cytochrome c oxidase subunit 2
MDFPWLPEQASTIASQVDLLLVVLIALSGFFTAIVVALIIYFGIKYRRGSYADRSAAPTTSLRLELGWIGGLLFLSLGTYIWATIIYFNMSRPPQNAQEIYVVGLQWMWKFQHPNGQQEINELHVPTGRPVRLIMASEDVIHSLYIPAFRLKYDVIPGRYTSLWFEASRTGEYHLFCAEYCGTQHSGMIGKVIVQEPRQYQEWLSGTQAGAPLAKSGEQVFQGLGCSGCHQPDSSERAPSLVGIFGQPVPLKSGDTVIADENYLRESILFPMEKVVAGYEPIMPTYEGRVSEEQLLALVAYIKSLSAIQENLQPALQETPGMPTPTGP